MMILFELLYLAVVKSYGMGIFLFSFFNKKASLWIKGRRHNFTEIKKSLQSGEKRIWFHFPSLGEFEQGSPVLEAVRREYPQHKIVMTFFSPSGYEVRKNDPNADYVFYMPLDGPFNSSKFIGLVNPEMAFFVKYDFWHYYIRELKDRKIPSYFISCIFRPSQVYFKWYGIFFEKILRRVTHLFVQNQSSLELLYRRSIPSVTVSGDTRFDRVYEKATNRKENPVVQNFKGSARLVICGSTWHEDERIITDIINEDKSSTRWIIAPHEIKEENLSRLMNAIQKQAVRFSAVSAGTGFSNASVMIIDNVGMLSDIYGQADAAIIGGGFGKGIHNILEAAVYGIPVLFGPRHEKFQEAKDLVSLKGAFCFRSRNDLRKLLDSIQADGERERIQKINAGYVNSKKGATGIIMNFLKMNH